MSKDKQSIQVTIRVRPLSQKQQHQDSRLCVSVQDQTNSILMLNGGDNKKFTFDEICENDTQQDIFLKVGKKSATDCLEGYNCCIFAYGQTGAGKTYTMMGISYENESSFELRGLIPRTLEYLFESIDEDIQSNRAEYLIKCYFLQIYNEQIIDLLNKSNTNLQIRQYIKKGVYVEGIQQYVINTHEEAIQLLKKGSKGRHVGSTCYNEASSRSHSVFTMLIESKAMKNGVVNTKSRHFHFIDLAGSQRTKLSMGERLKQGCSINKSLHVLGKVINSLSDSSDGKSKYVNYRDSKLTFLLKDSLGGNSKTHLIANISPCTVSYHETISTLSFARRVKLIKLNKASINEDSSGNLQSLKNQIKRLKQQLIRIKNGSMIQYIQVNNDPNNGNNQSDLKMRALLHRYVSEQIQKQTKLQLQMSKMQSKLVYYQKGMKQYAKNQTHLRMINAVYESKIQRFKEVEELLKNKANHINPDQQEAKAIIEYLNSDRESFVKQIESLKDINSNHSQCYKLLKKVLQESKMMNNEENYENLVDVLNKNNQFLVQMKKFMTEGIQSQTDVVSKTQFLQLQKQYITKENDLVQKLEQLQLQLTQLRNSNDENESLLKQSIDSQLNLQNKLKQAQQEKIIFRNTISSQQKIKNQLIMQLQQMKSDNSAQITELKLSIANSETQVNHLNKELQTLKIKIKTSEQERKQMQADHQIYVQQLESSRTYKQQQLHQLKSENIKNQIKIKQLEGRIKNMQQQNVFKLNSLQTKTNKTVSQFSEKIVKYSEQLLQKNQLQAQFSKKIISLEQQQYILKEKLFNQQKLSNEKDAKIQQLFQDLKKQEERLSEQKNSYSNRIRQLMDVVNQKQVNGNQFNEKINSLHMQILNLQSKLSQQQNKYNRQIEDYKQKISRMKKTIDNNEQYIVNKNSQYEQVYSQFIKNKQILNQTLTNHHKLQATLQNLNKTITIQQDRNVQVNEELSVLREKQKQMKIEVVNLQNSLFVNEKNTQIELEGYKELIRKKQITQEHLERQYHHGKQNLNKKISQLQKQLQKQKQLYLVSEQSIKKAMQIHLNNKQQKITQLKANLSNINNELSKQHYNKQQLKNELNICMQQNKQLKENKKNNEKIIEQLKIKNQTLMEELEQQTQKYEKELQQLEIVHNEQLDQKNQKIQKLLNDLQSMTKLYHENVEEIKHQSISLQSHQRQIHQQALILESIKKELQSKNVREEQLKLQAVKNKEQLNRVMKDLEKMNKYENVVAQNDEQMKMLTQQYQNKIQVIEIEYKQSIQQYELKFQQIQKQKQQLMKQIEIKQQQSQKQRQFISQYEQKINQLKKFKQVQQQNTFQKFSKFQQNQKQMQQKLEQSSAKIKQYQIKLLEQSETNKSLSQSHHQQRISFEKQLEQTNNQSKCLYEEVQKHTQLIKHYSQKIQYLQNLVKQRQQLTLNQKQIINSYETKAQSLRDQLNEIQSTYNKTSSQSQHNKSTYETKISQLQNVIQELQEKNQSLVKNQNRCIKEQQKNKELIHHIQLMRQQKLEEKFNRESEVNSMKKQMNQVYTQFKELKVVNEKLDKEFKSNIKAIKQKDQQIKMFKTYASQNESNKITITNLKLLIDNLQSQKNQLQLQLDDKDHIYKKLLDKIARGEQQHRKLPTNSEHYLKIVELLEKSRTQLLENKKQLEEQKKVTKKVNQELNGRQKQYQQLKKQCKRQLQEYKKANYQITQQLQQRENQYDELKKQVLRGGNDTQKIKMINKLKEQKAKYKRQIQILREELKKENQQKIRLMTQKRCRIELGTNQDPNNKSQLQKKSNEVRYLQDIIAEALNMLGVKRFDSKYKSESIRSNLIVSIKDIINETELSKDKIRQLQQQLQSKNMRLQMAQRQYGQMKNKATKDTPNDQIANMIRNRLSKGQSAVNYQNIAESQDKNQTILRSRNSNSFMLSKKR